MVDLKGFLSKQDKKKREYLWSLVVEPGWVQAGVWTVVGGKAEIVSVGPSAKWNTDEDLISAADTTLSGAVQTLPEDADEPSKTVFGVASSWVSDGQIKKEYLEKLRKVCTELDLEPTGFVALPESIAHLIKSEEGSPLSAVVVGVSDENLEISVFRLGTLVGTSFVARSVSVFDDVIEGLSRFAGGDDNLPSRFIVYNGKEGEVEEVRQALLKGQWDDLEKIKFLHTPKIEVFTPENKVFAVSLGGASEIADVKKVGGKEDEEDVVESEIKKEEVENVAPPKDDITAEDVGFVIGEDIKESGTPKASQEEEKREDIKMTAGPERKPEGAPPNIQQAEQRTSPSASFSAGFATGILDKFKGFVTSLFGKVSNLGQMGGGNTYMIGGGIFVFLLVVGFLLWWFVPKATVTVFVSPRTLQEDVTIRVDPRAGSVDFGDGVVPGEVLTTSQSGERTSQTTGTKTVGERATGTVEVRNGTSDSIRLPSGTVIASGDLEFTLDEAASVSAALSPSSPGTATVDVTASDIGAEYNLASDESFTVSNYPSSEVDAVSTTDFSGGSSRQIQAVSEEDQDNLLNELSEELESNATTEFNQKIGENQYFIEDSVVSTSSSTDYSANVGDEADNLRLSLTIDSEALAVDRDALFELVRETLKDRVPQGYVLRDNQIEIDFELDEVEDGVYIMDASVEANLLPEIDPEEIAREISGRHPPLAQDYLNTIPGFARAQINISPQFPGRLGTLPRVVNNIEVEIAAEQ